MIKKCCYAYLFLIYAGNSYGVLNLLNKNESSNNGLLGHSHQQHISSETKTAAKIAACTTVAKGICLGARGIKYLKKEINESSSTTESKNINQHL